MTPAEVIEIAFSRNIDVSLISQTDIILAKQKYVDGYISGYDVESEFYDDYCKPVIAYGCGVDCFNRIAAAITDKGIQTFSVEGAVIVNNDQKKLTRLEYAQQRNHLIERMTKAAAAEGLTVLVDGTVSILHSVSNSHFNYL